MAHFLPPEHVRQVNKLEWPKQFDCYHYLHIIKPVFNYDLFSFKVDHIIQTHVAYPKLLSMSKER